MFSCSFPDAIRSPGRGEDGPRRRDRVGVEDAGRRRQLPGDDDEQRAEQPLHRSRDPAVPSADPATDAGGVDEPQRGSRRLPDGER